MARLGDLLQRTRQSAGLSVDQLADCAHRRGLATIPTWRITRTQVRDEITYIETHDRTTFSGNDYRTFWNSVFWCLQQHHVDPAKLQALIALLILQVLPADIDSLLSLPPGSG